MRSGQQRQYHLVRRDAECGIDAGDVFMGWVMMVIGGMEAIFKIGAPYYLDLIEAILCFPTMVNSLLGNTFWIVPIGFSHQKRYETY